MTVKKAVMYGAGKIGRGFVGGMLSQSGFQVTFIDKIPELVNNINVMKRYPVCMADETGSEEIWIENISALLGSDTEKVAEALADCEFVCTSVGANSLKDIAENLAAGAKRRIQKENGPLNILICENLMDAEKHLEGLLRQYLTDEEMAHVGVVEATVGCVVPVQTEEMLAGNPLRIVMDRYRYLPIDSAAYKGEYPAIMNLVPFTPFHFYVERKLYIHNMGHALTAYLGQYAGFDSIREAVAEPHIRIILNNAMMESAAALSKKYSIDPPALYDYLTRIIFSFRNPILKDTCARVGADIPRKLAPKDRLVGAALNALSQGEMPVYLCAGIAAGAYQYLKEQGMDQTLKNASRVLGEISSLPHDSSLSGCVLEIYGRLAAGNTLPQLLAFVDTLKAENNASAV